MVFLRRARVVDRVLATLSPAGSDNLFS